MALRGRLRSVPYVTVLVLMAILTTGCSDVRERGEIPPREPGARVARDYPEWRVVKELGPTSTELIAGESEGQTREDTAFLLESPDASMTILAWYARSGEPDSVGSAEWVLLDEMYVGEGWRNAAARGLYDQLAVDGEGEVLLGAYQDRADPGTWHVGFYLERSTSGGTTWVRGDHLYHYDANENSWTQVAYDSGSDNAWNTTGPVSP